MKTFALAVLATTVLGIKITQTTAAESSDPTVVEPIDGHVEGEASTTASVPVAPGQTVQFTYDESPSTGLKWSYDETILDGLFKVDSIYTEDEGCKGADGCGGYRTFTITAGKEEGVGIFYACNTKDKEVRLGVMEEDAQCESHTVSVENFILDDSMAETYDLGDSFDAERLATDMRDLAVGDIFKVTNVHSSPSGYSYELALTQDAEYLHISEPMVEIWEGEEKNDEAGAPADRPKTTVATYTVEVIDEGKGNLTLKPVVDPKG